MNLHGIVAGAIGTINPNVAATLQHSTGYTLLPGGKRVPSYATYANVTCQIQQLTQGDLRKIDGLNLQGVNRKVYLNGTWTGVVRAQAEGGDLLQMADGTMWLLVAVLEQWPDWAAIAMVQQNGG